GADRRPGGRVRRARGAGPRVRGHAGHLRRPRGAGAGHGTGGGGMTLSVQPLTDTAIARRVAHDIPDGSYVNLGIGMPTLVADAVDPGKEIIYHSENGILGMGPAPATGLED